MIFKFQQGGNVPQQNGEQNVQQQIIELVQAAMQGDENAKKQVQQIMEAAQQGDQQAMQLAQIIQEVVKAMQSQARKQQIGGKLEYIHKLRTGVSTDETVVYEKQGGKLNKKIIKKDCNGSKVKPKEEAGGKTPSKKYFEKQGDKAKIVKKTCYFGGSL